MDNYITNNFTTGKITGDSSMLELKGVGNYLYKRLQDSLNINGEMTIKKFIKKFRNKTAKEVASLLRRSLQNKRSNQCVESKTKSSKKYHTRDVNKRGYNTCVALLRYAKTNIDRNLRFGPLRNANEQTEDTKRCGCLSRRDCKTNNMCKYKDGHCIPSSKNASGFEGVDTHPGQIEHFRRNSQRQRILSSARIPKNARFYADADSVSDDLLSYLEPQYVMDDQTLWRIPGNKTRYPR